jgi:hypothetical protein
VRSLATSGRLAQAMSTVPCTSAAIPVPLPPPETSTATPGFSSM